MVSVHSKETHRKRNTVFFPNNRPSKENHIISIDLQEMAPIEDTIQLQGDITRKSTVDKILQVFEGKKAQLVVCDGAPDVTGFHEMDQYLQSQLLVSALNIGTLLLAPGGTFIAKVFKGSDTLYLKSQFKPFFEYVDLFKPKSSRGTSVEAFVICINYSPPDYFAPGSLSTFTDEEYTKKEMDKESEKLSKFVTCGDLSGFDEEQEEEVKNDVN